MKDPSAPDADCDRVVGVEGKEVPEEGTPALVGRQARDRLVPRPGGRRILFDDRLWSRRPNGQLTHPTRRRHVLLDVQRRHRQHVADVVEPVARVVSREVSRVIEVDTKQVTYGVAVLGAIQAMDRRSPGIGCVQGDTVE